MEPHASSTAVRRGRALDWVNVICIIAYVVIDESKGRRLSHIAALPLHAQLR